MTSNIYAYPPPLDQLLTLGDARPTIDNWPDYRAMGISDAHIPELIRMACDQELQWASSESSEVWAPIHAWRALGELRAEAAIAPLITLFGELRDDDFTQRELPYVFGLIGPSAIPALRAFLIDPAQHEQPRFIAVSALGRIGLFHPEVRDRVIDILARQLSQFRNEEPSINTLIVYELIDLHATRAASIIKLAFDAQRIDLSVCRDWKAVQVELGEDDSAQSQVQHRTAHLRKYLPTDKSSSNP